MKPTEFGGFRGSRAKLHRAHVHGHDLNIQVIEFLERKPYKPVFDNESVEGIQEFRIDTLEPMPDNIACTVGDFMHNLRSALDHLAVDLVLFNNRGTSGVNFPSGGSISEFESALTKKGGFEKAGDYAVQKIRAMQIYSGGHGSIIRDLHQTDVIDKHFNIIGVSSKFEPYTVKFNAGKDDVRKPAQTPRIQFPIDNNRGKLDKRGMHPNMEVEPNPNPTFKIALHQPAGFRGYPIPRLCQELYDAVESIVNLFELDPKFKNI